MLGYVDDIVIIGNSEQEVDNCKLFLKSKFMIKDLGLLKFFLGIEVLRDKSGLCLSQRKYYLEVLKEFGVLGSKQAQTPTEINLVITDKDNFAENDFVLKDFTYYQLLIGKLIYLTIT